MTGQPIGIPGTRSIRLLFFLDNNKFNSNGPLGIHIPILPLYSGQGRCKKLEEKAVYKSAIDDELIMLEMTKREKKEISSKYSK